MKINETQKSKKNIEGIYTLLVILLINHSYLLPVLLLFGIELQKQINVSSWNLLYKTVSLYLIIPLFVLVIFILAIFFYQRFYIRKQIIKQDLKCAFCEKKSISELYKIPNFFVIFGIPLCKQHIKALDEGSNEFLYNEQKLYTKYSKVSLWLNILIIASGIISLYTFGLIFGLNGNIPLNILIYVLFTIQVVLYFYLNVRMFIKIRNVIENL